MKKLSVLFAAVMMFVTVGVAHAQKVASIDYESILAAMPETKKMTADLDTFSKTKGDELNKQAEAFQKEVQQ
jgi:outer membrane protein